MVGPIYPTSGGGHQRKIYVDGVRAKIIAERVQYMVTGTHPGAVDDEREKRS